MTPEEIGALLDAQVPRAQDGCFSFFDLVHAASDINESDWTEFLRSAIPELSVLAALGFSDAMTGLVGVGFALGKLAAKNEKTLPKVQ